MSSAKTFEKAVKKAAKSILVDKGIDVSNRRGSKELNFIVRKIASVSSGNLQDAEQKGQKLGEKISELSQQRGKRNLDRGVIRQIALEGEFFPVTKSDRNAASPTTATSEPVATSATEATATTEPESEISVTEETVPVTEPPSEAEPEPAEEATASTEPEISVAEETVSLTEPPSEVEPEPAEEESEVRSPEGEPSNSEDSESEAELEQNTP
ncbi:hypothetical protein [Baaleninema simplex]|uniref:hypothetical protein n=1 Tax=Baaleninema simplex TaxID=2862350 RepID=UPI00034B2360|nr:hypothetical protein [Baaleninema simplex]